MSATGSRVPPSPREWREGRVTAPPSSRRHRGGAPGARRWRAVELLYASAVLVVVVSVLFALLGIWFPGDQDPTAGYCDAPLAPGCSRAEDWPFVALFLGGPLSALLVALAIVSHVVRGVSSVVRARRAR